MVSAMIAPVVQSVVFLTTSGFVFALLLVIAEKKIVNYGPCEIDINDGTKKLTVTGGRSLLSSLGEQGIFIPSACGGRGTCAYCKVAVVEGGGVRSPVEEPYLNADEMAKGIRLSCQVKVRSAIRIRIPAELFSVKKFQGRVVYKKQLTHDIVELRIELKNPNRIEFKAGQYIQLDSKPYRGREEVMRAYSVSSPPSNAQWVDLIIRLVPDGICTTWVFEMLKENEPVTLSGPYGKFGLTDTRAPVLFIAGGSGMAPIWSILRDMHEKGNTRKAAYYFGAQTRADLFYVEELRQFEKDNPWFTFVPALSNAASDTEWTGERGLITDVLGRCVPDCSTYEAYLCGSPGMIDACLRVLKTNGLTENNIYYDKFA
jgi:Na+-transporting NADH:ubiquinone oxidoreductase subunit F